MIRPKRLLGLLASCGLGLIALPALAEPEPPITVEIGGRPIVVPMPNEDFVRCDGINPTWDKTIASFQNGSNRLLARFGTKQDREVLRAGNTIDSSTNFHVQTLRKVESLEIGTQTFASLSDNLRKEVGGLKEKLDALVKKAVEQGNAAISKEIGGDAALSLSDSAVLGFFDEQNKEALGFTMASNLTVKVDGQVKKSRSVVAAYIMPANGRLLMLYATRPYTGDPDRQEVERSVKAWGDAITAANAKIEGKPIRSRSAKVLTAVLAGVGVALALALIRYLAKKRSIAA